tara:strand:- start:559 stop:690 length:132 start_codon:yes stop_codon:yes gene_type:complete
MPEKKKLMKAAARAGKGKPSTKAKPRSKTKKAGKGGKGGKGGG